MAVTKTDNQQVKLKKKVKIFYQVSKDCLYQTGSCPIKDILAPSVDKWSLIVMYNLAYNDLLRFNELKKYARGISARMLSVTLKKLEKGGIVSRKIYPVVPPKVEYTLTPFGYEFADKLVDLNLWIFKRGLNREE